MTNSFVELSNITKKFDELVALDNVNLSIDHGQFVVLLGPSGSGKTTLLSILGGFLKPTSGEVRIDDEPVTDLPPARRPTVTVFQDYALFPHMTVRDNVGFGLAMRKFSKSERRNRADEILATVGLEGLGDRKIQQLSGGQRQRVALARAIVVEPKLLLLDEPLGALDLKIRHQMQEELVQLQRRIETTFVHVTHDQEEAMNIADVVVVMSNGRIEDIGPPERVYLRPSSLFSATFMGDTNILSGRTVSRTRDKIKVDTSIGAIVAPGTASANSDVSISIRPEQLHLDKAKKPGMMNLGKVRIQSTVFQGPQRLCHAASVDNPETSWIVRLPPHVTIANETITSLWTKQSEIVVVPSVS